MTEPYYADEFRPRPGDPPAARARVAGGGEAEVERRLVALLDAIADAGLPSPHEWQSRVMWHILLADEQRRKTMNPDQIDQPELDYTGD
ncbi:MAG: hypothetical protein QM804_10255 [Propionicimonas sp.]